MEALISAIVCKAAKGGLVPRRKFCLETASMLRLSMDSMELALVDVVGGLNSNMFCQFALSKGNFQLQFNQLYALSHHT